MELPTPKKNYQKFSKIKYKYSLNIISNFKKKKVFNTFSILLNGFPERDSWKMHKILFRKMYHYHTLVIVIAVSIIYLHLKTVQYYM